MPEVVKRPVQYWAEQFSDEASKAYIEARLRGTGVRLGDGYLGESVLWPSDAGTMLGKRVALWPGDWVVVSSLGKVRVLSDAKMKKEFSEA